MPYRLRYRRPADKKGSDPGTRTTTHPPQRARATSSASTARRPAPRASGCRPVAGAARRACAARSSPARRSRPVLVHLARAGPRDHALGERARRPGPRARPRLRRAHATSSTWPASRCPPAAGALPDRGAARAARDRPRASNPTRPTCRAAPGRPGLERRGPRACSASPPARPTAAPTFSGGCSPIPARAARSGRAPAATRSPASAPSTPAATTTRPSARLIEALLESSPRFRELWPRHEVLEAQIGTKVIDHPVLGRLTVHHLQSIPTSHPDLRLTQFVPGDAATRALARSAAAPASSGGASPPCRGRAVRPRDDGRRRASRGSGSAHSASAPSCPPRRPRDRKSPASQ